MVGRTTMSYDHIDGQNESHVLDWDSDMVPNGRRRLTKCCYDPSSLVLNFHALAAVKLAVGLFHKLRSRTYEPVLGIQREYLVR